MKNRIANINWSIMTRYFSVKETDIKSLYKRVIHLPIFTGTCICAIALVVLSILVERGILLLTPYIAGFLVGVLFTWKACIIHFYNETSKEGMIRKAGRLKKEKDKIKRRYQQL